MRVSDVTAAALATQALATQAFATQTASAREWFDDPLIARAVGLLVAHERGGFDPADGSPPAWDASGAFARGASDRPVFPRIDPCVIGVVEHVDGDRILLTREEYDAYLAEHPDLPGPRPSANEPKE